MILDYSALYVSYQKLIVGTQILSFTFFEFCKTILSTSTQAPLSHPRADTRRREKKKSFELHYQLSRQLKEIWFTQVPHTVFLKRTPSFKRSKSVHPNLKLIN